MIRIIVICSLLFCCNSVYGQKTPWYFPEYKHYVRPDSSCNQSVTVSIWGWQYLKIKVYDSCRLVEVSCYRSRDSTLKEKGNYYNSGNIVTKKGTTRDVSFDKEKTVEKDFIVFNRVGTWKFYNRNGRVVKSVQYKKIKR